MRKNLIEITPELSYIAEGFRSCNVYLLTSFDRAVLFDPSIPPSQVLSERPIQQIFATHAHYDHIGAVNSWKQEIPKSPFLMHAGDIPMLDDAKANASVFFGRSDTFVHPDRVLADGDWIDIDHDYRVQVLNTPGHTMGSSCFLIYKQGGDEQIPVALIAGDTLFDRGWGRTDFASGDDALMRSSLERLYRLLQEMPSGLPVCPGHGSLTTTADACRFLRMMGFAR